MKKEIIYNFKQWCLDNNRQDLLLRWDYELNEKAPSEVSYKSNKKYWFKCPKNIHGSQLQDIQYLTSGRVKDLICIKCRSFAQYILDNYNESYLNELIELNQDKDLWKIRSNSNVIKLNIICRTNKNHKYIQTCDAFTRNGCGYCSHRYPPMKEDSLGYKYPKILKIWSDKNKKSPYDYYPNSAQEIWLKCENEIHQDYKRKIETSTMLNLRCPICGMNNRHIVKGEEHGMWKGGTTDKNKIIRTSRNYIKWRSNIYETQYYTCQCCGAKGNKLNCHHLYNFSTYENLRMEDNNAITLCVNCHDVTIPGSFHNTYGTLNNTPEQLEEYINNKRKVLGIAIPFTIESYLAGNILKPEDVNKVITK